MKPTKITLEYEDGTATELSTDGVGSLYFDEASAEKAGKKIKDKDVATTEGGTCYLVNGIIVCP